MVSPFLYQEGLLEARAKRDAAKRALSVGGTARAAKNHPLTRGSAIRGEDLRMVVDTAERAAMKAAAQNVAEKVAAERARSAAKSAAMERLARVTAAGQRHVAKEAQGAGRRLVRDSARNLMNLPRVDRWLKRQGLMGIGEALQQGFNAREDLYTRDPYTGAREAQRRIDERSLMSPHDIPDIVEEGAVMTGPSTRSWGDDLDWFGQSRIRDRARIPGSAARALGEYERALQVEEQGLPPDVAEALFPRDRWQPISPDEDIFTEDVEVYGGPAYLDQYGE